MCVDKDKLILYFLTWMITLSNFYFWEHGYLFFFNTWAFMCSSFFQCMSLHVLIFLNFCIAHVSSSKPHIWERSLSFRTWSIYLTNIFLSTPSTGAKFLVDGSMFLRTPNVGAASVCGCTWSWSWEHDKSLRMGQ